MNKNTKVFNANEEAQQTASNFWLLSNSIRLHTIEILAKNLSDPLGFGHLIAELEECMGCSVNESNVSSHLRRLCAGGMVTKNDDGRYTLNDSRIFYDLSDRLMHIANAIEDK